MAKRMTDEQKAAAKQMREARAYRLAWEARQTLAEAAAAALAADRAAALAEVAAIRAKQLAAAKRAAARKAKAEAKTRPSAMALTRRRNAEARAAAALAARKAEDEARAKAAERAALRSVSSDSVRKSNAESGPVIPPTLPAPRHVLPRVTLRSPQAGLWEVMVYESNVGGFTVPFYQHERPDPKDAAEAIAAEMLRRRQMTLAPVRAAKPRKDKARVISPMPRGDSTKIRRIERQMEGV